MKRMLLPAALLVLFCGSQDLAAQARKIVFFEHFTNASCAPCASLNPIFEQNIVHGNKGNFIHMAYHTVWPGRDPMNAYNKDEVDARVRFYGVNGVPNIIMHGNRFNGSPSDISQEMLERVSSESSPLRIRVEESSNGTQRTVTATFTSLGLVPTAGIRVRAAVIESEINYTAAPGSNGEKDFPNVFRRFMTPAAGETFVPAAVGQSVQYTWQYDMDLAEWDSTRIYPVVWVQLDGSHEVINASAPFIPAVEFVTNDDTFKKALPQDEIPFAGRIENLGNDAASVRLSFSSSLPGDWSTLYVIDGNEYTGEADVTVPAASSVDVTVRVQVGDDPGIAELKLTMTSLDDPELTPQQLIFGVISGISDLIVNNDNSWGSDDGTKAADFQDAYLAGIAAAGSSTHAGTSLTTFMRAMNAQMLDDVGHVYYNAGWAFPGLTDDFARAMIGFLGQGGNVFIAGQDVGWDTFDENGHGTSATRVFYRSYLFSNYVADGDQGNATLSFYTYAGEPLFGGTSSSTLENVYGGNAQGQPYMYPDVLRPTSEGVAIAYYNTDDTKVAAVRGEKNNYKTVYFGLGMEQVKDVSVRSQIMKRTWQWFHGVISSAEYDAAIASLTLGQNYPNPVSSATIIPLDAAPRERLLRVYDINGRFIEARPVAPDAVQLRLVTDAYRPGVYYYQLFDGGMLTGSRVMQVVR
ncbi:MAG: T9SS type A sorting domain-containing protein [Bacteroidetes bacterium]|nr:T9SS type A sorting domain-containing protein [Bacteroidota bacterium]